MLPTGQLSADRPCTLCLAVSKMLLVAGRPCKRICFFRLCTSPLCSQVFLSSPFTISVIQACALFSFAAVALACSGSRSRAVWARFCEVILLALFRILAPLILWPSREKLVMSCSLLYGQTDLWQALFWLPQLHANRGGGAYFHYNLSTLAHQEHFKVALAHLPHIPVVFLLATLATGWLPLLCGGEGSLTVCPECNMMYFILNSTLVGAAIPVTVNVEV